MSARGKHPGRSLGSLLFLLGLLGGPTGCTPSINIAGVYFPGWLVSAVAGVVIGYAVVFGLSARRQTRELGDSGLLFISLVAGIALSTWWVFFSDF